LAHVVENPLRIVGIPHLEPFPDQIDAVNGHLDVRKLFDARRRVIRHSHDDELRVDDHRGGEDAGVADGETTSSEKASDWEFARHRESVVNVSEAGDEAPREFDDEVAKERRAQGLTVAALNAFSAPGAAQQLRDDLRYADPDDAIEGLASAIEEGTLRVPRLVVLDSLVKLASRRGDELRARQAALDTLLEALVRQARARETEISPAGGSAARPGVASAVLTVRGALESVAFLSGFASTPPPWKIFVLQAGDALGLSRAEIDKPRCNDAGIVMKGNLRARALTVEFHTDASPDELRHFCDPRRWHECSAYQKEMTEWRGAGYKPDDDRPPDGWRRDLLETVQLAPGLELTTPLRFTHTIQDPNNPSWVHLDYVLIGDTKHIEVDEGALDVRRVTTGKHQGRTRVGAIKAIRFKNDQLNEWTTVACDTFWMDLVIDAAVGCLRADAAIDSA
jgi:hypothetical protein